MAGKGEETDPGVAGEELVVLMPQEAANLRLDKALADLAPALGEGGRLSRARIQALIMEGSVTRAGIAETDPSTKARAGASYVIRAPAPQAAQPQPQAIPLKVLFEDAHLIVVDKPAGMASHPAPGSWDGTLVNALLHHCGASLSGIGGVLRPGIVHRLDKDTTGVMVAAKSDAAHQGLSALFANHTIERAYLALVRGALEPRKGLISTQIGRARFDRQRMAVLKAGGRTAITRYATEAVYLSERGEKAKVVASRVRCRLETGRTHQIRVHMAHKGAPVLGDALYGSSPPAQAVRSAIQEAGLQRQALHASVLGFVHPITGEPLRFETPPPADMVGLESELQSRFFRGNETNGP